MKKLFILCIAAAMVLSLVACAGSSDAETSKPTGESAAKPTTETTTTPTTVPATTEPAFQQIVLVSNQDVTAKIIDIHVDDIWGYTLEVYLENHTNKELMFTVEKVSVNGFMCDPFWAATVDSGMKANEDISFSKNDFDKNGIETVESITLTLRAYDNDNWLADDIINETITINP